MPDLGTSHPRTADFTLVVDLVLAAPSERKQERRSTAHGRSWSSGTRLGSLLRPLRKSLEHIQGQQTPFDEFSTSRFSGGAPRAAVANLLLGWSTGHLAAEFVHHPRISQVRLHVDKL